ncbi:MAG TPA: AAA family ATPase, partial [Chloroflexota bacterium]
MPDLTYKDLSVPLPQPTQLLGRARELELIGRLLTEHGVRLLTITGPAGVGKTRLALEAGSRLSSVYTHGIVFVDLAPIRDSRLVLPAIAQALNLPEASNAAPLDSICAYLQDRSTLLILDNFEQVLPASAQLCQILENCSGATLLVTSRWALHLQWEHLVPVSPLQLPDLDHLPPAEELAEIPAVALFLERARARRPDFTLDPSQARTLAELCIRLDGLPLAIELAAARLDVLPLATIAQRLDDRLRLLRSEALDL